jgi:hypothetical protein
MVAILTLSGQAKSDIRHLSLVQAKPDAHTNAANPNKPHDGDTFTIYAKLMEDGKTVGHIAGAKVEVRNGADPGATDLTPKRELIRLSVITFSFGDNDTLVAQGVTVDKPDGMVTGESEVRAITGGTGKYEFASGQVTTTREPDGTYHHEIDFKTL